MPAPEMQKAIERLRLLLATINGKEEELEALSRDFRRQLDRAPSYAIHAGSALEASLNAMGEIQERLNSVSSTLGHLSVIKTRAQQELQALSLTDKIEEAKRELAALRERERRGEIVEETRRQIKELRQFIEEASIRAGQAITGAAEDNR